VGGVLGAKIDFVLQNGSEGNFLSGSGLVWYGGVIGGAIGVIAVAAWRKIPIGRLANMSAPGLAIGYAIGRIGCQLSGDGDYGRATSLPWGMSYPDGEVPTTEIVHPTPVYETAAMLVVFFVLWRLRDRLNRPWQLFGLWAILAGAERFLVEFVRRNEDVALGLTAAQLFSIGLMAIGAVLMIGRTGAEPAR
jgi:phosphatidylglycerol:prolipoprotein diacylglycerol transferase